MQNVSIKCLACEHDAEVSVDDAHADDPLAHGVFRCDECGVRLAHGKIPGRVVLEPLVVNHRKWLRIRVQDPVTKRDLGSAEVDPELAIRIAKEMLEAVV